MTIMQILSKSQVTEFETPPDLSYEEKEVFFEVDVWTNDIIESFDTSTNKVAFVLILGYLRCTGRFFLPNIFLESDIQYVAENLLISVEELKWQNYSNSGNHYRHMKLALKQLGITTFKKNKKVKKEVYELVTKKVHPKKVFWSLCDFLKANKIEIPAYNTLHKIIAGAILDYEKKTIKLIKRHLRVPHKKSLERLLEYDDQYQDDDNIKLKRYKITSLKKLKQSIKLSSVNNTMENFLFLKEIFNQIHDLVKKLSFPKNVIQYYGTTTIKSDVFQVSMKDEDKKYLHLICFVVHQYYRHQDTLIDILLKSVQKAINHSNKELIDLSFEDRKKDYEKLKSFIELGESSDITLEEIKSIIESLDLSDNQKVNAIKSLLNEKEGETLDFQNKIEEMKKQNQKIKRNSLFYECLEKRSIALQRKLSEVIKHLDFDYETSNKKIIKAIDCFKLNDKSVNKNAPISFLEKAEKELIIDDEGKIKVSLYKVLLFTNVAGGLKSGAVNLKNSYKYQSLDDYLISKEEWVKLKAKLIKEAGLENYTNIELMLEELDKVLENSYSKTNENIIEEDNPHVCIVRGKPKINTPKVFKSNTKAMKELFPKYNYTSLLEILFSVNNFSRFLDPIIHYQHKYTKKRPGIKTFFAAIIAYGCNIGVTKMTKISNNVNKHELSNVVNWYLTQENIEAACNSLLRRMSEMDLINIFKKSKAKIHSSSDGQKFATKKDSLNANHSYKYFGKGTGVSINSFIDESIRLFYSTVISSSEREAAYVIDGLMQNDVVKSDIHSTDTHGYSELIFGITHLMNISFAPRIKNFKDQKLYSLKPRKHYVEKGYSILPKEKINTETIKKHWDDILRFVATIKLGRCSASQIFKRLSSYSKRNPLYTAIKNFGRIIKSMFMLKYIDDVTLRQTIEKQLNKVESLHRLAKFVFFGNNQEFTHTTKEEQEVVEGCKRLIELSIICWNYLYLSQLIANKNESEREKYLNIIKNGSILVWHHINQLGEYDFSDEKIKDSVGFDFRKILNLKIA